MGGRAPNHTNTSARGKSCRLVSGVEVGAWGRKETELESPPQLDSSVVAERAFPWVDFPRGGKCTFPALSERSEKGRRVAARGEEKEDEVEFSSGPNWNAGQNVVEQGELLALRERERERGGGLGRVLNVGKNVKTITLQLSTIIFRLNGNRGRIA